MHRVGLQVPFQHLTLLLPGKIVKHIPEVFPELAVKHFSQAFRCPHHMKLAFPFRVA